ncbi:uncharacterized protein C4orf50 homolog [Egretta garzetta]|uniref:uncharacterized protein C4orf50 homolog n=1 Tax=Egretta garzetta TaxID=188379 RepID=UPI00163C6B97|nr:uncharacterized protein C4orf50 homolog [Egretta garzetta]XP_035746990.1 uncharacterized protein C4orf50 homolog [Egretta garzetta]XP_035746991.1 uncharacterized protein C4orf50 homolog [Egretta garzetta]XP_035746992.1 uncharacterized protein C4orf50 homolog [Egretta garzetta]
MKELELSHKTLLVTMDQLNMKLHQIENADVRIKEKLRGIREDLINLVENQKKSEKKQKEKLHWLQEQLKTKEDELKRQSEYFEHYKQNQRQQTAVLRERECYLRGEVSRLEKQVLDLSAHIVLLTSELEEGMVQYLQQKLESAFSGTQSYKHPDVEVMELKTCIENVEHDMKSHLETFQQNLKFLREKEEDKRREQADLMTELQCSQDTEAFLRRKLEESCHHVYRLKLSEINLQEEMEELLDENRALKDQGRVKLKKKKEKDARFTRLENRDNSVDWNAELIQDDIQNWKWGAVVDSLRSKATQTPVVLLHAKESETPGYSCDGLKQMEELPEELLPVLQHNSNAYAEVAGLAEIEQVTFGMKRAGTLEDSFTLFRCTPSYCGARLLPSCSENLTNDETSKETKDEENFSLLKEQAINLPAKMFPVSVIEVLMRKKPKFTLLEPESYHISAVTSVKKVRSLDFCEANTTLCFDVLCLVAEGRFSDKASALLCGKIPCTVTEIFTSSLEKYSMEKHWENKKILPKSLGENECLDKVVDDGKYHQIFRGRAKGEEIQHEKAQPQQVTCVPEESSEILNKTELIRPGKQGMETKDRLGSPQSVQNLSVDFKDLKKHFEGNPQPMQKQRNPLEICTSDVNRVYNGENMIKMEAIGEQPQKPPHQANPSSNIGLKKKKDQTLKLCEPNEKNFSCQKIAAENMQYASQNFFLSEEERYPLNTSSPVQERALCLNKLFLPGSNFYECFCHLSPLEAGSEHNVKIHALEKAVTVCSQRIFLLMQENENYSKKVSILQQENERYAQMMCALEEEMDAYFQYILAVDEVNIVSFQNLLNEKEVAGGCFNDLPEENIMSPGAFFVEIFSKNLSCVAEKNKNSENDSLTIASKKLPRSVLSLDGRKTRYFQLLSDLKEERSRCFKEIAKLLQEKENYVAKYNELIQEKEGNLHRISLLEGEKETLLGSLAEVKREQDKYSTVVSELQECKTSCYQTISDLQEEKCVLKREMDRIKKETSEQLDEFQKANANFILENRKLKEFLSSLGFTYEDLRKDKSSGARGKIVKLKEESQQHSLKPKKVETACSVTQTEEEGVLVIDPSNYFPGKEGSIFESYSVMKEQVKKAKEELKIQQKELQKSRKEVTSCTAIRGWPELQVKLHSPSML